MEAVKCEAFLAAAELGSLTATAELLGYTQSGVTRMIGTLEEELGFPLFLRSKKGVQLTDISANGKMVDFKATATDTAGLIGEGTHQRAVITVDRFMDKCQAKLG